VNDEQANRVARWIEILTAELDVPAPQDLSTILDIAKDAAHSVERPAAPVSTYILGYAVAQGADPRVVAEAIARLAQEFDV
jgi:hypothetical protein